MPTSRQFLPLLYLLGIAFLVIVYLRIAGLTLQNEFPLGYDARSYVAAARAIQLGLSPYNEAQWVEMLPDLIFSKYLYPPVLAVLLMPLTTYPILSVTYGLVLLAFVSGVVFAGLLSRSTGWKLALLAVFLFPPTWHTIYLGQINLVVAALMLLALYDVDFDRQFRMGVDLALASVLKLTPLVPTVLMFLRGYKRAMLAWILSIVVLILIVLPIVGLETWFEGSTYALRQFWTFPNMISWTGILVHYLPGTGEVIALILSVVLILYTLMRIRKIPPQLVFSAGILLPLLIVRIVWEHHAVMALPALLVLWRYSPSTRLVAGLSWLAIGTVGGFVTPIALTFAWISSCWPHLGESVLNKAYASISSFISSRAGWDSGVEWKPTASAK